MSIITGVSPGRASRLPATAASIEVLQEHIGRAGWSVNWIVVVDGPGLMNGLSWPAGTKLERLAGKCGTAACINRALALCHPSWVLILQAGDELLVSGMLDLLQEPALARASWAAANMRITSRGTVVTDTTVAPKRWEAHQLAQSWSVPFAFHPAALVVRSSLILEVGGWPALPANEDLAAALYVSELGPGIVTAYRIISRELQRTTKRGISRELALREDAFATITAVLNARRAGSQHSGVTPPAGARTV
ncbi:MAG: hypothetical protein ACYDGY_08060 [Acidimicrobiales bacterium]